MTATPPPRPDGPRGPGRPRTNAPGLYHATSVRLNRGDLAMVDEVCATKRMSRNEAMRALIRKGYLLRDTIPVQDKTAALEVGPPLPGSAATTAAA